MRPIMRIGTTTGCVRLSCEAMGTRFDLVLRGDNPAQLRAAGEEALHEIDCVDRQMGGSRGDSDLSRINARAADAPVRVQPQMYRLLERCLEIADATEGAFDITSRPLDQPRAPGDRYLRLDPDRFAVSFTVRGVAIDFGAAARGYAIDRAVQVLAAYDVAGALLHAGASSIHALGDDEGAPGWTVRWCPPDAPSERLSLRDEALSVATGRAAAQPSVRRPPAPVAGVAAALVVGPHSFECGALASALLVLGRERAPLVGQRFPGYHAHLV